MRVLVHSLLLVRVRSRLFLRLLVQAIVQVKRCRIVRLTLLTSVMLCLFDPDKTNGK